MAAVIAAAFVESDPARLVEIGLSEIPRRCRLAAAVRSDVGLDPRMPHLRGVHAAAGAAPRGDEPGAHGQQRADRGDVAVLREDGARPQHLCVGDKALDTDCNGATTGSIVGAAAGRRNFGGKLAAPLHDTVKPLVFGFQQTTFAELAERTLRVHQKVCQYAAARHPK